MNNLPPGTAVRLDEADERIISALKEDARMPFSEIARRLGVSAGMVRQRFNRLVDLGVIQVAVIPNRLVTGDTFMAMVGVRADPGKLQQLAQEIARFDEVIYLVVLAGTYNLLAEITCRDQDHVLEFLEKKLGPLEGVRALDTFAHLRIVKEVYS